jgi:hypothetical protein
LSATVPGSVAHWKIVCGEDPPVREIEIRAGLRWSGGRERIRERRASPRVQAVVEVKEGKITAVEDSWAARSRT